MSFHGHSVNCCCAVCTATSTAAAMLFNSTAIILRTILCALIHGIYAVTISALASPVSQDTENAVPVLSYNAGPDTPAAPQMLCE